MPRQFQTTSVCSVSPKLIAEEARQVREIVVSSDDAALKECSEQNIGEKCVFVNHTSSSILDYIINYVSMPEATPNPAAMPNPAAVTNADSEADTDSETATD